jgi:hypothetical protein
MHYGRLGDDKVFDDEPRALSMRGDLIGLHHRVGGAARILNGLKRGPERASDIKQTPNSRDQLKESDNSDPKGHSGGGLLGYEIAVLVFGGVAGLAFSGYLLGEARKPTAAHSELAFLVSLGLACLSAVSLLVAVAS